MTGKIASYLILALATVGFVSCNSSDSEVEISSESNTAVTSFSLNANDKILENLDSVYFSIDLERALIYNADSLPYGTDVSRLVVSFTTNGCSVADLIVPRVNQSDTTINYLENSTDSIDFSNGPVKLHIVSTDKMATRDYKIYVNVHQTKPDSLAWHRMAWRNLPTMFDLPTEQKTVMQDDDFVCLSRRGSEYSLVYTDMETFKSGSSFTLEFPLQVSSFTAMGEDLFVLAEDGALCKAEVANMWTPVGENWHHIYGAYGDMLLGVEKDGDQYYHVTYPSTGRMPIEGGFPVSGTSQMLVFETKWSDNPQAILVGGVSADGVMTGDTWSYDGSIWAKINKSDVIPARSEMTLVPYFTYKTNEDNWKVTKYSTLIAMFGRNDAGECASDVYISYDQGMHWAVAGELMQIPAEIPARCNAQAYVRSSVLSRSSGAGWTEIAQPELPRWLVVETLTGSRAVTDIEEWECPYIYLFGGENESGDTYNTVWRGVINRLTFKPII